MVLTAFYLSLLVVRLMPLLFTGRGRMIQLFTESETIRRNNENYISYARSIYDYCMAIDRYRHRSLPRF